MPSTRPLWSGNLRLSLVVIPVQMYAATTTENAIGFNMLHRETGERIRNLKVIETDDGLQEVPEEEIIRGYEHEKGRHVLLHPEEIDVLKPDAKHFVDLVTFVDAEEIDERYFNKPYYLLPDGEVADEGYAVIRDSLKTANKVAVGQLVMSGRSHIVAIRPFGTGLLLNTLRYASEIRGMEGWFDRMEDLKISDDAVSMARDLIAQHAGKFEPEKMADPYKEAVRKLIEAKVQHKAPPAVAASEQDLPKVVNIMDALKRSMRNKVSDGLERRGITKAGSKGAPASARGTKKPRTSRGGSKHSVH